MRSRLESIARRCRTWGILMSTALLIAWPGCCQEGFNEDGTMFWSCPWPWSLLT